MDQQPQEINNMSRIAQQMLIVTSYISENWEVQNGQVTMGQIQRQRKPPDPCSLPKTASGGEQDLNKGVSSNQTTQNEQSQTTKRKVQRLLAQYAPKVILDCCSDFTQSSKVVEEIKNYVKRIFTKRIAYPVMNFIIFYQNIAKIFNKETKLSIKECWDKFFNRFRARIISKPKKKPSLQALESGIRLYLDTRDPQDIWTIGKKKIKSQHAQRANENENNQMSSRDHRETRTEKRMGKDQYRKRIIKKKKKNRNRKSNINRNDIFEQFEELYDQYQAECDEWMFKVRYMLRQW